MTTAATAAREATKADKKQSTKPIDVDFAALSKSLYDRYIVALAIRDRLCGGIPKNAEMIKAWVAARTGFNDELTEVQTKAALETMTEEVAEKTWIGFASDERGLFIMARNVKAMFKEAATMLRLTTQKIGSKQILQHGFEIKSCDGDPAHLDRIHLGKMKPDGTDESPIHVNTAQGPRTALRRMDYVTDVTLKFEVWVLKTEAAEKRHLGAQDVAKMLAHAQENGLGASRSQGEGKLQVLSMEQIVDE